MLHDIVHDLDPEERYRYGQLLAYLASADRNVTREEMSFFEQRLGATLLSPQRREQLRQCLNVDVDLTGLLGAMQPKTIKLALRDAAMMTLADRHIDDDEKKILLSVGGVAGLGEADVDKLIAWVIKGYHWMQEGYDQLGL
ncbi:MAG: tellurite resistance TerB family protein [Candidatus Poseidoniales archaeon]|jgi:hypothetical protein|tara:strand:- start:244 stop:666 length:423 start_codon:yes stop_codon:yes gene_type:complete